MELTAVVKRVEQTETFGGNGFEARNLIVTTEEQFSQTLEIQFTQGRCILLDNINPGDRVKIKFNLKGKETMKDNKPKVFTKVEGWAIEKVN
jgi:single-strand DNA-binding protein